MRKKDEEKQAQAILTRTSLRSHGKSTLIVVFCSCFDGPQRMDEDRRRGGDTDHPWSTPSSCPVATHSLASTEAGDAKPIKRVGFERARASLKSPRWSKTRMCGGGSLSIGRRESTAKAALQEALRKARMEARVVQHRQERAAKAAAAASNLRSERLKVSLKMAQEQSRVRPLGERLDSPVLERAKGPVSRGKDLRSLIEVTRLSFS